MPASFQELQGSPRLTIGTDGLKATRVFKVAWTDVLEFIYDMFGYWTTVGGQVSYTPPAVFPLTGVVARNIEVEPFDPGNPSNANAPNDLTDLSAYEEMNTYDAGARVTVKYDSSYQGANNSSRSDQPGVPDGTFLAVQIGISAEYMTLPNTGYTWTTGGADLPEEVNVGLLVPSQDIVLSWERVPAPPWNAMELLQGCTNDATFMGHAAEHVLFLGAQTSTTVQYGTDFPLWNVEYHFKAVSKHNPSTPATIYGWNHLWDPDNDRWDTISQDPYPADDFSDLFKFE